MLLKTIRSSNQRNLQSISTAQIQSHAVARKKEKHVSPFMRYDDAEMQTFNCESNININSFFLNFVQMLKLILSFIDAVYHRFARNYQ